MPGRAACCLLSLLMILALVLVFSCPESLGHHDDGFLDYIPSAIEPCPSHYKCGAQTVAQVELENRLFADLRESNKYENDPNLTGDLRYIVANQTETTTETLERSFGVEGALPEGLTNLHSQLQPTGANHGR